MSLPYRTITVDPPWHYEKINPDKDREGYVGRCYLKAGFRLVGTTKGGLHVRLSYKLRDETKRRRATMYLDLKRIAREALASSAPVGDQGDAPGAVS